MEDTEVMAATVVVVAGKINARRAKTSRAKTSRKVIVTEKE